MKIELASHAEIEVIIMLTMLELLILLRTLHIRLQE